MIRVPVVVEALALLVVVVVLAVPLVVVATVGKAHKTCQLNRHCVVIKSSVQVGFCLSSP